MNNRLLNALAFAAIVMAVFVSNSKLPKKLASSPVMAQVVQHFRGDQPPVLASVDGIPPAPQFDEARLERVIERAQRAQVLVAGVESRRALERARVQVERASGKCKVVRLDQ